MDERGVNNPPGKRDKESEREKKVGWGVGWGVGGCKMEPEIRRHHSSKPGVTALFKSHHFGDKNKPNYST